MSQVPRIGAIPVMKALLQRMARWRGSRTPADVVALEFAVESGAADAEHASGKGFIAFDLFENALDGGAFDIFQIGSGE